MIRAGVAAIQHVHDVRDGLRAAGLMPASLPPRRDPSGRRRPTGIVGGRFIMASPGPSGEHRMTPGDLPGESGMPA